MVRLCLMASQGYVPRLIFNPDQPIRRLSQDYQPILLNPESTQDVLRPGLFAIGPNALQQSGQLDTSQLVGIDSTIRKPVLMDVQDTRLSSILFSCGIVKQCTSQWEISEFLKSGSSNIEKGGQSLSILADLMGIQEMHTEISQHEFAYDYQVLGAEFQPTLFHPSNGFYLEKPLLNLMTNLAHKSEFMTHLDGQVAFTGSPTEMKDILSRIAEFYLSKNSLKWRKQSLLVPQFDRLEGFGSRANVHGSLKLETMAFVPVKSPQKIGLSPSPKKKTNRKSGKERELYRKNYFHSCESLLSIIVDKKRHGKTAILELKRSGPELTHLLTQLSASIAGTGLAIIFSVVSKVASGRIPFCTSKLLNTVLGLGLVWLSWAVNRLRTTIINISKNSGKWVMEEDEMMKDLDSSVRAIYIRAATLMAVLVLRLA